MIDPEVARLRRLRDEALLVRQIARTFESSQWAANESLLDRCACASWRIARVISGRLRGHPYAEYQRDAGLPTQVAHGMRAYILSLTHRNRGSALVTLASQLSVLSRQLDDAIRLAWSSDFSEALSRAHGEVKSLSTALAKATAKGDALARPAALSLPVQGSVAERMVGELGHAIEGDWPYLAL